MNNAQMAARVYTHTHTQSSLSNSGAPGRRALRDAQSGGDPV